MDMAIINASGDVCFAESDVFRNVEKADLREEIEEVDMRRSSSGTRSFATKRYRF